MEHNRHQSSHTVFFPKTLPTCTACCCPLDPLCPSDPSHLRSHGSSETFSGVAPSAAGWHQGQSCCCCRAAGEANPQQWRRWNRRHSAESSGGVSWGACRPETNESPHSTKRQQRVEYTVSHVTIQFNLIFRQCLLKDEPGSTDQCTTGERGTN